MYILTARITDTPTPAATLFYSNSKHSSSPSVSVYSVPDDAGVNVGRVFPPDEYLKKKF